MYPQKKNCNFCHKKLAHNNKINFCLKCLPSEEIVGSFRNGETIQGITKKIFNSSSGYYRELVRKTLIGGVGSDFLRIRKINRNKAINRTYSNKLPVDFIKSLFSQGKITPQIHMALLQKGYSLHISTLRKILLKLELDYRQNYKNWQTNRGLVSKGKKDLIRKLWMNGESINEISKITELAPLTVKQYLHEMGFKTKMLQFYYSEPSNNEEKLAKTYFQNKGYEVKKCLFLCQRKLDKPFTEILKDPTFPFPPDLRKFCQQCPIKNLQFEEQELYDFMVKKDNVYGIVEVKKIYTNPRRRAHFTLGQFLNLPQIIKAGIPFTLLLFENGKIDEKSF